MAKDALCPDAVGEVSLLASKVIREAKDGKVAEVDLRR